MTGANGAKKGFFTGNFRKPFSHEDIPVEEQHLAHAKNLMKSLERESTGTAKRDSESERK